MSLRPLLYALVCVVAPVLWGCLVAHWFERVEARLARRRTVREEQAELRPRDRGIIEYYI